MKVLALYNLKGGVGKSTAAVNLAHMAALDGWRTLIWDLDPQGATTHVLGGGVTGLGARRLAKGKVSLAEQVQHTGYGGLDLIPASFSYRNLDLRLEEAGHAEKAIGRLVEPLAANYDLCLIDCAPSISLVSESVFHASQALLVPVIPNPLSLNALARLAAHLAEEVGGAAAIWPFFNLVDRRKTLHRQLVAAAADLPYACFHSSIPYAAVLEQMAERRAPLATFAPRSPAAAAFTALWVELRARLVAPWGRRGAKAAREPGPPAA